MANTINESAIKKLKLIITVVDRAKADFYLDILSQFDVNFQMVTGGKGTAHSEIIEMLREDAKNGVPYARGITRQDIFRQSAQTRGDRYRDRAQSIQ